MRDGIRRLLWATMGFVLAIGVAGCTKVVDGLASPASDVGASGSAGFPTGQLSGTTLEYGEPSADAIVDVWIDPLCPYCGDFITSAAQTIESAVTDADAQLRVHLVGILENSSSPAGYSLRAGASVLCSAQDDVSYPLLITLFTNQPAEGSSGYSDDELAEMAAAAGASDDVGGCITSGDHIDSIDQNTDEFLDEGFAGTPTVLVNGEEITADADDLADAIESA